MFKRRVYETLGEIIGDLVVGFVGWYAINGLAWACLMEPGCSGPVGSVWWLPLPINILALVGFAIFRLYLGLGMLAAVAVNLTITLTRGLVVYAIFFIPFFTLLR